METKGNFAAGKQRDENFSVVHPREHGLRRSPGVTSPAGPGHSRADRP